MRPLLLALLLAALSPDAAFADAITTDILQVTGQLGIGGQIPVARLDVRLSASDDYALKVSSQDGTALMVLDKAGRLGIGVAGPSANLDVFGTGDSGDLGLQLRSGNSSSTLNSSQLVFALGSTNTYRHSLRTRAVDGQNLYNSMDFYLWNSTNAPTTLGNLRVMSLQAIPYASTGCVHILPPDTGTTADADLEVSNGVTVGGGTMHRASVSAPSAHDLKLDITYFDHERRRQAYEEVKALRHVRFRYKISKRLPNGEPALVEDLSQPLHRGLIYEDAPASIKGQGNGLVLNDRLANLEMALIVAGHKIEDLEKQVAAAQKARRRR